MLCVIMLCSWVLCACCLASASLLEDKVNHGEREKAALSFLSLFFSVITLEQAEGMRL